MPSCQYLSIRDKRPLSRMFWEKKAVSAFDASFWMCSRKLITFAVSGPGAVTDAFDGSGGSSDHAGHPATRPIIAARSNRRGGEDTMVFIFPSLRTLKATNNR